MFLNLILTKLVVATALAFIAEALCRRGARPQFAYAAWFAVVIVLLVPPMLAVPLLKAPGQAIAALAPAVSSQECPAPVCDPATAPPASSTTTPPSIDTAAGSVLGTTLSDFPWQGFLTTLWLGGAAAFLLHRAYRRRTLGQLVQAAETTDADLQARCAQISTELGIGQSPRVVMANGAFSPFLWHPLSKDACIVFPEKLLASLSTDSVDVILRHELVHLRRRDTWRHHVEAVATAVWWWFPGVWLARKRLREYEELCADAEVIRSAPNAHRAYATALLDAHDFLRQPATREFAAAPAFAKRKFLKARIEMIMGNRLGSTSRFSAIGASALCLGMVSLGFLTIGNAKDAPVAQDTVAAKASQPSETKKIKEYRELSAKPGGTLTLKAFIGSIVVKTHDKDTVIYDADYGSRDNNADHLDRIAFDFQSNNGNAEITIGWKDNKAPKDARISLGHVLTIPKRYHINVTTSGGSIAAINDINGNATILTSGGSVAMQGIEGDLNIQTSGGSIAVNDVLGDATAKSSGGSIKLGAVIGHLQTVTSGGSIVAELVNQIDRPIEMTTSGGNIALTAPKGFRAHLVAATNGGIVSSDFLPGLQNKSKTIDTTINGGGPKVLLNTSGGSISLAQSKG